jgi:DeoR/GlpR family transcriptional regulator of sugar metabolism
MTDRAIMGMGSRVIIVADYTKCERVATAYVAPLDNIDMLITTKETPSDFIRAMIDRGINVLLG